MVKVASTMPSEQRRQPSEKTYHSMAKQRTMFLLRMCPVFIGSTVAGLDEGEAGIRLQVQNRMDVKKRDHDFNFTFGEDGDDEQVSIFLSGVNPELGQTLASTGLTVWRASHEMARFMWEHRRWFAGKCVVELGAGLGLCGVLASYLCRGGKVVITDGGEEFTSSAMEALKKNLEKNGVDLSASGPRGATSDATSLHDRAHVFLERLTWGDHAAFSEAHSGGFDFIVAADVIYEEEAVTPLLRTVVGLLRLRETPPAPERTSAKTAQESSRSCSSANVIVTTGIAASAGVDAKGFGFASPQVVGSAMACPEAPSDPIFLLAFARRNVSIDRVLKQAEGLGLRWRIPGDFEPHSVSENVYLMWLEM